MVHKRWLIITNALLWAAAGFNIARIGILCAISEDSLVWLWSIPVFAAFGTMFMRVIGKNTRRILDLPGQRAPLYRFLNVRGYLIIAFMMSLGFGLRRLECVPQAFFAFFYTGLGTALCLNGLLSLVLYFCKYKSTRTQT